MNNVDLIKRLADAADAIPSTDRGVIRSLLIEAVAAIEKLRNAIDRHPAGNVRDAVTLLEITSEALATGQVPMEQCRTALLDASMMIGELDKRAASGGQIGSEADVAVR